MTGKTIEKREREERGEREREREEKKEKRKRGKERRLLCDHFKITLDKEMVLLHKPSLTLAQTPPYIIDTSAHHSFNHTMKPRSFKGPPCFEEMLTL